MNLLQKLDRLEHADSCAGDVIGDAHCTCGLSEVRGAVHELLMAAGVVYGNTTIEDERDIPAFDRMGRALSAFAQDDGEPAR